MPGIEITTSVRSGPAVASRAAGAAYFVVGQTERGDTSQAVKVTSLGDFETKFGGRVSFGSLWDDLRTFFEEGGSVAYVARVVGGAPVASTLTLADRAATPQNTLRIDAVSPGAWGQNVTVAVQNGTLANTFKLLVSYPGAGGIGTETYDNLTSPTAAVAALASSSYVRATNLGSPTVGPNNNPALGTATALGGGADDRASVTSASYIAALDRFGPGLGAGAVAIPGQPSSAVGASLLAHASSFRRIALLAVAPGSQPSDALNAATALRGIAGSESGGLFFPAIQVTDDAGGRRTITPEGFIAACRARAHEEAGPFRAAAGEIARARFVLGAEVDINRSTGDQLNDGAVNAIRTVAGGLRNYGWRSLSADAANFALLSGQDTIDYVVTQAQALLEQFVFATIDGRGQLFSDIGAALKGLVDPLRAEGGLYERVDVNGNTIDPGYRIDTSDAVNTPTTISLNQANATVSIRVSPTGELVKLKIAKVGLTAAV